MKAEPYLEPIRTEKSFVEVVRLDSKYASGISSTVEMVCRMSVFIDNRKSTLPK